MLTGWLRDIVAIAAGIAVLTVLMTATAHAGNGSSLTLSKENGGEIGLLCQYMDTEHEPPPPEAADLCDAAAETVMRHAAPAGKRLLRLGVQDMTAPDRVLPEPGAPAPGWVAVDGPTLLLVMEARRDWAERDSRASAPSRLLLHVRTARGGASVAVVGFPPVPVALGTPGWRGAAEGRIAQVIDFNLRE
ncbi:hypothetical protein EI613_05205 [Azospirillum sp. 412522]|nr:hypothetical protein [Azospirillum sp. 412522]MBY6261326.1 hypothetical protein [Azospirillum sp. 412522]